jgi:hypothetical protein
MGVPISEVFPIPLAQIDTASPTRDLIDYYILEHPVLGMLAAMLVGIVAAEILRRLGKGRAAAWTLVASAVLGAAIIVLGVRIETPRERVTAATRTFVEAVAAAKPGDVEKLLGDRVTFRTDGRVNSTLTRDWVVGVTRGLGGAFKSHSVEVQDVMLSNDATMAQTRFLSRAEFAYGSWGFVPSTWEFTWRRPPGTDAWRVTSIECLTIYGKPATGDWITWGNKHLK